MCTFIDCYYNVDVFKHAIFDEWLKYKTEKFDSILKAVKYAKEQIKHGNRVNIYKVSKVVGWE